MTAILLALGLIVYNNLANKFSGFHGWAYVPMNLALTAATLAAAVAGPARLDWDQIGFDRHFFNGALVGVGLGLIPIAGAATLLFREPGLHLLADARMARLHGLHILYLVLVRIPVGTALTEEIAFRGVLPALLDPHGTLAAALLSSALFGLWHVQPGINRLLKARPDAPPSARRRVAVNAVLVTMAAGLVLTGVRYRSGTLGVPFGIHAAINSGGALLALAAHRRLRSRR